ncbi:hypothetical protein GY45DRAFT_1332898 [Cubamyces sp. BRFM 1775]|nr:hypothetical protein GY45DRAFT_1332898 [Cubamyces sp. BRFM 1775]
MSYQDNIHSGSDSSPDPTTINTQYIPGVYANYDPAHGSYGHVQSSSSASVPQQQLEGGHQDGWHTHMHRHLAPGHGMYIEDQCYPNGPMGFDGAMDANEGTNGRNQHVVHGQHRTTMPYTAESRHIPAHSATYRMAPNPNMQQPLFPIPPDHRGNSAYTTVPAPSRAPYLPHPPSAPPPLTRTPTIDPTSGPSVRCEWAGGCGEMIAIGSPASIRGHLKEVHFAAPPASKAMMCCQWGHDCKRDPMQWENIPKHIAECHTKTMRRQCGDCGADFARSDTLTRHQQASSCPRGRGT